MALCCHTMPSRNEASSVFLYMSIILLSYISLLNADIVVVDSENTTVDVFIDFELSFSSRISDEGIQGMIALADPEDACEKLSPPPFDLNGTLRWFVLIKRYPCALETKVQHAKDAHYGGAVIYNKEPGGPQRLVPSGRLSLASDIGIPAVLIGYDDGRSIKSQYLYDKGFTLVIYPESPFNINAYLLPFASVVGSCLFIMVVFMIVKCIKDRRRSRRNRLSSRHLKQLPTTKYKKGDQYDVCAICLEEYNEGEKLRILPCSHAYHNKCIDPWLTNNKRTCPVCKRKVALSGCSSDSDSDSELDLPSETTPLLRNAFRRGGNQNQVSTSGGTFENSAASASGRHAASTSTEEAAASRQIQGMHTTQVDFHSSSEEPQQQQQRRHGRRRQQWPRSGCSVPFDAPSPASVNGEHPGNEEDSPSADSSSVEIRSGSSSSDTSLPSTSSPPGGGSKSRSAKKPELVV